MIYVMQLGKDIFAVDTYEEVIELSNSGKGYIYLGGFIDWEEFEVRVGNRLED